MAAPGVPLGAPSPKRPIQAPEVRVFQTRSFEIKRKQTLATLRRVALPTIIVTVLGFFYFDNLSIYIRSQLDLGAVRILMQDEAQFIQNFLTVIGLLFSILAGNAYAALYQQQESIYFALFQEVSEAKSLLEQVTRGARASVNVLHDHRLPNLAVARWLLSCPVKGRLASRSLMVGCDMPVDR